MKKLFTLIAAALCALTASAKETIPGFKPSQLTFTGWTWNTIASLGEGAAVDNGDGTADASGITYFDASAHDYVILEYTAATCAKMKAIVQYTCNGIWGKYGAEFNTAEVETVLNSAGGMIAVQLDMDKSDKVYSIALQDPDAAGTLDLKDAYFATEEEYLACKEAYKQQTLDAALTGWGSWGNETHENTPEGYLKIDFTGAWGGTNLWLGGFDASEFGYIVAEIEPTDVITQLFVQYTNTPAEVTVDPENPNDAKNQTAQAKPGETEISIPLYASVKNSIAQIAIQSDAPGTVIVKKIYWKASSSSSDPTGINGVNAAQKAENNVRYNLLGVKNGNGIYIMNGKKYMK